MSDLIVVGLCGAARAGKDTAAQAMVAMHGFTRIALADGVRESLNSLDGATWDFRKERGSTPHADRLAMQWAGTEGRILVGSPNHWIDHALIKLVYAWKNHGRRRFVVPDIRFPHEPKRLQHYIEGWGGRYETWTIRRDTITFVPEHSSEESIDSIPCSVSFANISTREWFIKSILDETVRLVG